MTEETTQRPAVGPVTQLLEKKRQSPQFHDYPNYFYAGFWIRFLPIL